MTPEQKIEGFQTLMAEVSAALADVVTAMQEKRENSSMEEISSSLADIAVIMEKGRAGAGLKDMIDAIKAIRPPAVNVNNEIKVIPSEVIVQVMPADNKGATWEVTVPGKYGAADRVMTIKRTN